MGHPPTSSTNVSLQQQQQSRTMESCTDESLPFLAEANSAAGSDTASTDSSKTDDELMDACLNELLSDDNDEEENEQEASNDVAVPDVAAHATDENEVESFETERQPGGLVNLGNTCYMASALQMLSSAEDFIQSLSNDASPLHNALLDVVERLRKGETVRPAAFKEVIDERSCLFAGYHQQDAHEFLTTLLDLLDEDYKQPQPSEEAASCTDDDAATAVTDTMSDVPDVNNTIKSLDEFDCVTTSFGKMEEEQEEIEPTSSSAAESSSTSELQTSPKRPRTDDPEAAYMGSIATSTTVTCTTPSNSNDNNKPVVSFSTLDVDAIAKLLHGDASSDQFILPEISTTCCGMAPQYRLIGGRMSTADVMLAPYESEPLEESSTLPSVHDGDEEDDVASQASSDGEAPPKTSPVDDFFTTSVQVRLTCDSCKYTRYHKETFLHLSIEIASDCVEDGLRRFFAPCKQEIKCEKCFYESATQTMTVKKLPMYMLVHFKRFIVDVSPDYSSISYRKDGSPVYYGESLVVDDSVASLQNGRSSQYKLQSLVHHIGASATSGHYIADTAGLNGDWWRCNDAHIRTIESKQAIDESRHTAYMAMYRLESDRFVL